MKAIDALRFNMHQRLTETFITQVDMGATFICGTGRDPPVNPMLTYAVDCLGLGTRPKLRDGPAATALFDRYCQMFCQCP